jgi:hypothetical protein
MQIFRLAPMTRDLQATTAIVLLVPVGLVLGGRHLGWPLTWPPRPELAGLLGFILLAYLSVWLFWRPRRFEVSALGLAIVWPLRRRTIVSAHVGRPMAVDRATFRRDYGRGMRVGAGGLWGGFGLLMTGKGTLSMYISRTDAFVLVPVTGARTLMLTPERPQAFVAALEGLHRRP